MLVSFRLLHTGNASATKITAKRFRFAVCMPHKTIKKHPVRDALDANLKLCKKFLHVLDVDCNVNTCGKIELLEFVNRVYSRLNDVNQALVSTELELFHALFVNVNRTIYGKAFNACGQWNRSGNPCAGSFCCFNDISSTLVYCAKIVAL